jgi:hypothetical protein
VIEQVPAVKIVTAPETEPTEQTDSLFEEYENAPVPEPPEPVTV